MTRIESEVSLGIRFKYPIYTHSGDGIAHMMRTLLRLQVHQLHEGCVHSAEGLYGPSKGISSIHGGCHMLSLPSRSKAIERTGAALPYVIMLAFIISMVHLKNRHAGAKNVGKAHDRT